ncbi:MAG: tetratricopeptide repeat protein [Acidobacteria bacterium]|nr:tetratricopeptide repeat protein [Acidobacteriota bacterium]
MKQLKYAALVAMAVLTTAPLWAGPQARIFGIVTDTAGNPVPTATITYTTDELTTFEKAIPVKGDGTFKALILDATRVYIFHVSAPGYIGQDQEFKVPVGTTDNRFEFVLKTVAEVTAQQVLDLSEQPGYKELEEGRKLLKAGQKKEAAALFEQALAAIPDLLPAMEYLAEVQYDTGNFENALATAKRCLEEDDESLGCVAIAANAAEELGDTEAHTHFMALYQELNPEDPASIFNQAVVFLNAMDDDQAKPLLEKCLDADPEFPKCLFEYGMVLLRGGDIDGAKAQFKKYLEVAPDGEDATTAAETVKWL